MKKNIKFCQNNIFFEIFFKYLFIILNDVCCSIQMGNRLFDKNLKLIIHFYIHLSQ